MVDGPTATGAVLGFDYGEKRIGYAVGTLLTGTARPLNTLNNHDANLWRNLDDLVEQWRPIALVVGIPLTEDGNEQPMTRSARSFAGRLADRYRLPVHHGDERYTTKAAEAIFADARSRGAARARDARKNDAIAAQLILEQWFEQQTARG